MLIYLYLNTFALKILGFTFRLLDKDDSSSNLKLAGFTNRFFILINDLTAVDPYILWDLYTIQATHLKHSQSAESITISVDEDNQINLVLQLSLNDSTQNFIDNLGSPRINTAGQQSTPILGAEDFYAEGDLSEIIAALNAINELLPDAIIKIKIGFGEDALNFNFN